MRSAEMAAGRFQVWSVSPPLPDPRKWLTPASTTGGRVQDRYAGDIGDYVKLGLLRHLSRGRRLGVAWYLHPDESHNGDGRHVSYLQDPDRWRRLDPALFDGLRSIPASARSVAALENFGTAGTVCVREPCACPLPSFRDRSAWRMHWFLRAMAALKDCDIVFADPDNGLVDDSPKRRSRKVFAKQIPLSEAVLLSAGRTAVIYHHNSRYKGGHDAETSYWIARLGPGTLAVRSKAWSCRTFFVVNPDSRTARRTAEFCDRWSAHGVRMQG